MVKKIRILDKIWLFKRVKNLSKKKGVFGLIDHPTAKNKTLSIDADLRDMHELEILIHEFLHGADWTKDEEWIVAASTDLAKFLWRLGYRKCEH